MLYQARMKDVPVYIGDRESMNLDSIDWMNENELCTLISSCNSSLFVSVLFRGKIGNVNVSWLEPVEGT
jgi:hypothetical protein